MEGRSATPGHDTAVLAGAFALAMLIPGLVGSGVPRVSQVLAAVLIAGLTPVYGCAVSRAIQLPAGVFTPSFEIVGGFTGLSLVHLAATVALGSTTRAAVIDALVGGVLVVQLSRVPGGPSHVRGSTVDAVVLVAASLIAGLWTRDAMTALARVQTAGVFKAWVDFFLHASEITYLRDYGVHAGQSLYLAHSPQAFYHRASYALAALYSALSGTRSIETATTFWLPLGLTLCGFAAYGFGSAVGGRAAGLASLGVLFLLPDASMYGLRNSYFSFHWLIQIVPGTGFAIAITLAALGALATQTRTSTLHPLLGSVVLAASAAAFRVQVAVLGTAVVALLAFLAWRPSKPWHKLVAFVTAAIAMAALLLVMERIQLAPRLLTGTFDALRFFEFSQNQGTDHGARYAALIAGRGWASTVAVGYGLTLAGSLGALLPAAIVLSSIRGPRALDPRTAVIPLVLMVAYLALILIMPTPVHGDYTEYAHRSFAFVYAVLGAFVGAAFVRLLSGQGWRMRPSAAVAIVMTLGTCGSVTPWIYGRDIQQRWAPEFASVPMSADLITAAAYVRAHSRLSDVTLSSSEDRFAIFVGLSERPAFVSRTDLYRQLGGEAGWLADARSDAHRAVRAFTTLESLQDFGRTHGIAWYVLDSHDMPWPDALKNRCSSCDSSVRTFDLR